jgi:hypothetical protein
VIGTPLVDEVRVSYCPGPDVLQWRTLVLTRLPNHPHLVVIRGRVMVGRDNTLGVVEFPDSDLPDVAGFGEAERMRYREGRLGAADVEALKVAARAMIVSAAGQGA